MNNCKITIGVEVIKICIKEKQDVNTFSKTATKWGKIEAGKEKCHTFHFCP
ncbi:MAG: hypothetical protein IJW26_04115 [Clostridia bacterium]|nr:hypothetical protein [Clostridia bacterium]